jgi:lysophospholipase L1-like esterase
MGRRAATILVAVAVLLSTVGGCAAAFGLARRSAASPAGTAPEPTPPSPVAAGDGSAAPIPYRVVGLGDSVPSGSQCDCTSYVSLVGQQFGAYSGRPSSVDNLARDGLTTSGLLAQLQLPAVRSAVADADLVMITIGANDFDEESLTVPACQPATALSCYQSALSAQQAELSALLAQVNLVHSRPGTTTIVTGYWNVFLDGRVGRSQGAAYVAASNALTMADNGLIAAVTTAHADTYVDIYTPFKGDGSRDDTDLLAPDGDHPNAAGHRLIAQTIVNTLEPA